MIQVTSSSAIGGVAPRATVRPRSRRMLNRITPFGRRRVIPLAMFWAYGSRCLILAAMQPLRGLLLERAYPASRWSWPIASPVIPAPAPRRRRWLPLRPVGQGIPMLHGITLAIHVVVAAAHRTLRHTFRRFRVAILPGAPGSANPRAAQSP